MLEYELKAAILQFVRTFRVVRRRHVYAFFSDEFGRSEVQRSLNRMIRQKDLFELDGELLSAVWPDKLRRLTIDYADVLPCLDMLTGMLRSSEVKWYALGDYPVDIMFLTVGNELYDATSLEYTNWAQKCSLLSHAWKKGYVGDQPDVFNHIAVLTKIDLAKNLREYNFSQFVVVGPDNGIVSDIYDN